MRSIRAADVRCRGQRRHRQPDGLRRDRRDRVGRKFSRRAGGSRRGRAVPWRSPIWRRSANGGPNGWSIRAISGLPAFLTRHGGLQSGPDDGAGHRGRARVRAKDLAHPASVDTIPTSGNKEDHVSMSMAAASQGRSRLAARARRHRDRNALRVSGDRSAGRAHVVGAVDARARSRARAACRRSTSIARRRPTSHDRATDRERRYRTLMLD